jgi:hypothetical protein
MLARLLRRVFHFWVSLFSRKLTNRYGANRRITRQFASSSDSRRANHDRTLKALPWHEISMLTRRRLQTGFTRSGFDATGWRVQQQQKHGRGPNALKSASSDSVARGRVGQMPRKGYPRLPARVADAVSLQQRVADGVATPAVAQEHQRILKCASLKIPRRQFVARKRAAARNRVIGRLTHFMESQAFNGA